jgi:hypothetical protein
MAKQTVITSAMAINTGRAPAGVNGAPAIGLAVRVDLFFDVNTPDVDISMTAVMQNGGFNTIQCLYIDNSLNAASVVITLPGIQQRIVVNGFSQALEPLYVSDTACSAPIHVHCEAENAPGFPVSLWFSNVPQPFFNKTGIINNSRSVYALAKLGNTVGHAYSWNFDLSALMLQRGVADWPTIYIDNSRGFQHIYVYDGIVGSVVYIVNPYTVAQFPTLQVGSSYYTLFAIDQIVNGPQAAWAYGYDVNILFKSAKQEYYSLDAGGQYSGLYSTPWDQAFVAGGGLLVPANEARKNLSAWGTNIFSMQLGGIYRSATLFAAGIYTCNMDITELSSIQRGVNIFNGATAQNIAIRDRY